MAQCGRTVRLVTTPLWFRSGAVRNLPIRHGGSEIELMGPTVFGLLMCEPIGIGDRGSLGQAVRRDFLGLYPRRRSHTLMDRLAVDAGVDQKMHDLDVVRPEFARHVLSHRAQSEFSRRKYRESLAAANAV